MIDRSFGFDTAVEEAQRAINAAHTEAESVQNGIGLVKLMGRYSGKFMHLADILSKAMHIFLLVLSLSDYIVKISGFCCYDEEVSTLCLVLLGYMQLV